MNGESYFNFIQEAKLFMSKNSENNFVGYKMPEKDSLLVAKQREYLSIAMQKAFENLDDNLVKFESKYSCNGLKVNWAVDYDDVLNKLRSIISKRKVKTANYSNHYIYKEIGLEDLLKKEKVKYTENIADINFIDVDMLVSETGSLLVLDSKMDKTKRINSGSINVFIIGLERVIKSLNDAEIYWKVMYSLPEKKYDTPILLKPKNKENDYLFILDNGRTNMFSMKKQRIVLTCLHCGECKKVCPVYNTVGDVSYNNVFTGPIGNIMLPFFEDISSYKFAPYACLLCGNCEKVCPVLLPLKDLILENRIYLFESKNVDSSDKKRYGTYKTTAISRKKMNRSKFFRKLALKRFLTKPLRKKRKFPELSKTTFNQQYIQATQNESK